MYVMNESEIWNIYIVCSTIELYITYWTVKASGTHLMVFDGVLMQLDLALQRRLELL